MGGCSWLLNMSLFRSYFTLRLWNFANEDLLLSLPVAPRQIAKPTVSKMAYYYEPRDYDLAKGWFPFRNNHFVVNSEKVREELYILRCSQAVLVGTCIVSESVGAIFPLSSPFVESFALLVFDVRESSSGSQRSGRRTSTKAVVPVSLTIAVRWFDC